MIELRPYQTQVIEEVARHRRPLLVAPTGSGKTAVAAGIIERAQVAAWDRHCRIKFAKAMQKRAARG